MCSEKMKFKGGMAGGSFFLLFKFYYKIYVIYLFRNRSKSKDRATEQERPSLFRWTIVIERVRTYCMGTYLPCIGLRVRTYYRPAMYWLRGQKILQTYHVLDWEVKPFCIPSMYWTERSELITDLPTMYWSESRIFNEYPSRPDTFILLYFIRWYSG